MPTVGGFVDLDDRGRVRELTTAYLKEIRELAMAEIRGMKYTEREVRWCITVPAIWDDEGKAVMRRAAVDAGFPDDPERLLLAIEPEAAALYCYLRLADADAAPSEPARLPLHLDGFRFVVIDCGGGTVDITAYESDSGAGPSIALREIGLATGGHLGSEYVNQAFRDTTLGERFGPAVLKRIERDHPGELLRMSRQWELAKRTVEVERDASSVAHVLDPVRIEVPAVVWTLLDEPVRARLIRDAGGLPRQIVLPPDEVEGLLDETVDGILDKVAEQLATIARTGGRVPSPRPWSWWAGSPGPSGCANGCAPASAGAIASWSRPIRPSRSWRAPSTSPTGRTCSSPGRPSTPTGSRRPSHSRRVWTPRCACTATTRAMCCASAVSASPFAVRTACG
ncbi:hypothetical protein ACFQ51_03310 [Streptomyces kaempferi]